MNTIRESLSRESYKNVAKFYRDVKRCGTVQRLYWFLDRETFSIHEDELVDYVKMEILLNFSFYREKRIIEHYNMLHPRGKRKQLRG